MIHTTKNIKWVIGTSVACILLGILTFFTFINQTFIKLNDFNLRILLSVYLILLLLFFILIFKETYKAFKSKKKGEIGAETSFNYLTFFSATTLIPSLLIAIFSLFLFNIR